MSKVKNTVVVFFNTDFSKNIPTLENIYENRFDDILYLVPDHYSRLRKYYTNGTASYYGVNLIDRFYSGFRRLAKRKNEFEIQTNKYNSRIIRVKGFQYFFQDFFWQARKRILSIDAQWYWFISDDVFINKSYNADNISDLADELNCSSVTSTVFSRRNEWIQQFHPSIEYVEKNLNEIGCLAQDKNVSLYEADHDQDGEKNNTIMTGPSDIFAVHQSKINLFLEYCHQSALRKIFVEVAIPNILMTQCDRVHFIENYTWDYDQDRGSLSKLTKFCQDESQFYYHPVKLSNLSKEQMQLIFSHK